jgi:hypothetical protein
MCGDARVESGDPARRGVLPPWLDGPAPLLHGSTALPHSCMSRRPCPTPPQHGALPLPGAAAHHLPGAATQLPHGEYPVGGAPPTSGRWGRGSVWWGCWSGGVAVDAVGAGEKVKRWRRSFNGVCLDVGLKIA